MAETKKDSESKAGGALLTRIPRVTPSSSSRAGLLGRFRGMAIDRFVRDVEAAARQAGQRGTRIHPRELCVAWRIVGQIRCAALLRRRFADDFRYHSACPLLPER